MIYEKLLEFQKKEITLKKDANNPYFNSKYVTLNEVLSKVKPVLNEMGIVLIQSPEESGVRTILKEAGTATTETSISCFVPYVGHTDMQKLGSAITYAKRYALISLLGLEDEDDDGNTASDTKHAVKGKIGVNKGVIDRNDEPFIV